MPPVEKELQAQFFDFLFREQTGYVCISTQTPGDKATHRDIYFRWPSQRSDIVNFIQETQTTKHVYFCVHLLDKAKRKKENALPVSHAWSDLDTTRPETVSPIPSLVIQSSPGRYQAIWRFARTVPPEIAQEYSRKLAYLYSSAGADKGGWDLSQVLRVPYTINHKYDDRPAVAVTSVSDEFIPIELFEALAAPEQENGDIGTDEPPVPELTDPLPIIQRYAIPLSRTDFAELYEYEPDTSDDWSRLLWKLINTSLEAGLDADETFSIASTSNCNKYARDGRPARYLWRDILKAQRAQLSFEIMQSSSSALALPELYEENETVLLPDYWIDDYSEWACSATDALPHYHALAGSIAMSAILASSLRLETSYGVFVPNLWAMILGESTITRKTTAMQLATHMLLEIDENIILATDGSTEGILQALSIRPSRSAVFFRDEVSGFFNSVVKKDYLAGIVETFTQLYDSPKIMSRQLRKEKIIIQKPVFIFFAGGIRDRVYEALNYEHVVSGFVPRFLVVSGDGVVTNLRPTGPPEEVGTAERARLLERLTDMYEVYNARTSIKIGESTFEIPSEVKVELTPEAWTRYGQMEMLMVSTAHESSMAHLALPTFERLSRSLLKLAMLLAASRKEPKDNVVTVEKCDLIKAATFIQDWGRYSIDLALNCGVSGSERAVRRTLRMIDSTPGIMRSDLMRQMHLNKREADELLTTLEDRGEIRLVKRGKMTQLWTV